MTRTVGNGRRKGSGMAGGNRRRMGMTERKTGMVETNEGGRGKELGVVGGRTSSLSTYFVISDLPLSFPWKRESIPLINPKSEY